MTKSILLALVLSLAGGALCRVLHGPLPWMIGPLVAVGAGKLAGISLSAPRGGRQLGQILIGTALGLYFTPVVAQEVLNYAPLVLAGAALAILLGCGSALFLSRIAGIDKATAFFSCVPGGAAEMSVLGERFGAGVERVALAQSLRMLLVVLIIPSALTYSGVHGLESFQPAPLPVHVGGLLVLLGVTSAGGMVLSQLGVTNAWMLGPLAVAIALTVSGASLSAVPPLLTNGGQLLVGCALGSRFDRSFLTHAPRYVIGVVASILVALTGSGLFALGFAWLTTLPVPTLLVATAPGGLTEMCMTATVLRLSVPLVMAFHVTRVVVLVTCTAPVFRIARKLSALRTEN